MCPICCTPLLVKENSLQCPNCSYVQQATAPSVTEDSVTEDEFLPDPPEEIWLEDLDE